jgi:hypothetical protein
MYVDGKNRPVAPYCIAWKNNKTEEVVRGEAMEVWGRLEIARIVNFNRAKAVSWAGLRLLRHKLAA